jgi:hypothetical protein
LKTTDLNALFPKDFNCVRSLVGDFDDSQFRGSAVVKEGGLTVATEEVVLWKQVESISLLLSNIEPKNGDEPSIFACGILHGHGFGRLYSDNSREIYLNDCPYLLADVAIFLKSSEFSINLFPGYPLLIHLYVKEDVFENFLILLRTGQLSQLTVDAETWRSEDQQQAYLRADRDQRLNGDIDLSIDDQFAAFSFSFEELQSAIICRHAGEEMNRDHDSAFSRKPKKAFSIFRLLVTFIEIVAGLLFVYWNMH